MDSYQLFSSTLKPHPRSHRDLVNNDIDEDLNIDCFSQMRDFLIGKEYNVQFIRNLLQCDILPKNSHDLLNQIMNNIFSESGEESFNAFYSLYILSSFEGIDLSDFLSKERLIYYIGRILDENWEFGNMVMLTLSNILLQYDIIEQLHDNHCYQVSWDSVLMITDEEAEKHNNLDNRINSIFLLLRNSIRPNLPEEICLNIWNISKMIMKHGFGSYKSIVSGLELLSLLCTVNFKGPIKERDVLFLCDLGLDGSKVLKALFKFLIAFQEIDLLNVVFDEGLLDNILTQLESNAEYSYIIYKFLQDVDFFFVDIEHLQECLFEHISNGTLKNRSAALEYLASQTKKLDPYFFKKYSSSILLSITEVISSIESSKLINLIVFLDSILENFNRIGYNWKVHIDSDQLITSLAEKIGKEDITSENNIISLISRLESS